jgi:hypothetical protein
MFGKLVPATSIILCRMPAFSLCVCRRSTVSIIWDSIIWERIEFNYIKRYKKHTLGWLGYTKIIKTERHAVQRLGDSDGLL